jgi:hypothetical protein
MALKAGGRLVELSFLRVALVHSAFLRFILYVEPALAAGARAVVAYTGVIILLARAEQNQH